MQFQIKINFILNLQNFIIKYFQNKQFINNKKILMEVNMIYDREIDPKDYKFSEEQINNFKQKGILKEDKTIDQYIIPPNQIEIRETIGRGSGGVVKLAVDKITGVQFALKEMSVNLSPEFQKQLDIELHVLMKCKHPNIIKCYGASLNNGQIQIAMEYMDFGTLDNLGQMFGKLDQEVLGPIFVQCLKGLDYLHSDLKIIHRDIKPQNILINKQGEVKLTDFGVSGKISTQQNQKNTWTGTVTYMAPERIIGESYGTDSDLWSLGITMLELATGKYPYSQFQYNTFWQLLETIQQNQPPELPDDYDDKDLRDVLNHCVPMLSQWLDPVYE
ncbi:Protein kinase-like domain [Pseudocohnilembus persalinus]|uniref:mitogen-activated protein kinase kinase n=1 Tax=Pseudocohnilembus persalinus TaxID=266149 RepID=A0A0V0QBP5_PSEPJ|nr:Protein kinase-like domain [Pseudocohnilembus persalinus]|eukprot:KRW99637.1 Protein kinase-like domain [Pseudocohnilembus persalinus]